MTNYTINLIETIGIGENVNVTTSKSWAIFGLTLLLIGLLTIIFLFQHFLAQSIEKVINNEKNKLKYLLWFLFFSILLFAAVLLSFYKFPELLRIISK